MAIFQQRALICTRYTPLRSKYRLGDHNLVFLNFFFVLLLLLLLLYYYYYFVSLL